MATFGVPLPQPPSLPPGLPPGLPPLGMPHGLPPGLPTGMPPLGMPLSAQSFSMPSAALPIPGLLPHGVPMMQPPPSAFPSTFPAFAADPTALGMGFASTAPAPFAESTIQGLATIEPGPLPVNVLSQLKGCVDGFGGIVELAELVDAFPGLEQSQLEDHFDVFHSGSQLSVRHKVVAKKEPKINVVASSSVSETASRVAEPHDQSLVAPPDSQALVARPDSQTLVGEVLTCSDQTSPGPIGLAPIGVAIRKSSPIAKSETLPAPGQCPIGLSPEQTIGAHKEAADIRLAAAVAAKLVFGSVNKKRSQSRSQHKSRSRSRKKKSRSRSGRRKKKSCSRSRKKKRSRSRSRKKKKSRSRSGNRKKRKSRSRSHSRSKSRSQKKKSSNFSSKRKEEVQNRTMEAPALKNSPVALPVVESLKAGFGQELREVDVPVESVQSLMSCGGLVLKHLMQQAGGPVIQLKPAGSKTIAQILGDPQQVAKGLDMLQEKLEQLRKLRLGIPIGTTSAASSLRSASTESQVSSDIPPGVLVLPKSSVVVPPRMPSSQSSMQSTGGLQTLQMGGTEDPRGSSFLNTLLDNQRMGVPDWLKDVDMPK